MPVKVSRLQPEKQTKFGSFADATAELNKKYGAGSVMPHSGRRTGSESPNATGKNGGQATPLSTPTGSLGVSPQTARQDKLNADRAAQGTRQREFGGLMSLERDKIRNERDKNYQNVQLAKGESDRQKLKDRTDMYQAQTNRTIGLAEIAKDKMLNQDRVKIEGKSVDNAFKLGVMGANNQAKQISGENAYKMGSLTNQEADSKRRNALGYDTNRSNERVAQFDSEGKLRVAKMSAFTGIVGSAFS